MKTGKEAGMLSNCHKMLVSDIIRTKYIASQKGQHHVDHQPLEVHSVPDMDTAFGSVIGGKGESEKTVVKGM